MEKTMIQSNYDKMKNDMASSFLQYDQEKIIQKFSLEHDDTYLYISFLARNYRIHRLTGMVEWSNDSFKTVHESDYNEVMTIYDVLCYSKDDCHLAHEWVNINSISGIKSGNLTSNGNFFQGSANFFDGKLEQLESACKTLSGRKKNQGDLAYEFDFFSFLPVSICFWESDEDFPASLQILVDKNILDYMHYETLMFALSHLFDLLKKLLP